MSNRYRKILQKYFTQQNIPLVDVTERIKELSEDAVMVEDLSEDQAKEILDHLAETDMKGVVTAKETIEQGMSSEKSLDVSEKVQHPGSVYDAEKGEFVKINPERQRVAMALQQRVDVGTMVTAVALKKISDEKFFLELGYSSFKEYANTALPFGERTAKRYLTVGRKFSDLLPEDWGEGTRVSLLEDESGSVSKLSGLGLRKLYELSRVDDADFSEVISDGVVKLADGSELDLDEIKEHSSKHLREHLDAKDRYQKELEEQLNKAEQRAEKAEREKTQAEQDAEMGRKYKELYGPKSKEFEMIKAKIQLARSRALDLNQALSQITDVPEEEFPALGDELRELYRLVNSGAQGIKQDNLTVRF